MPRCWCFLFVFVCSLLQSLFLLFLEIIDHKLYHNEQQYLLRSGLQRRPLQILKLIRIRILNKRQWRMQRRENGKSAQKIRKDFILSRPCFGRYYRSFRFAFLISKPKTSLYQEIFPFVSIYLNPALIFNSVHRT